MCLKQNSNSKKMFDSCEKNQEIKKLSINIEAQSPPDSELGILRNYEQLHSLIISYSVKN